MPRHRLLLGAALLVTAQPWNAIATPDDCAPAAPRDWSSVTSNTGASAAQWSAHRGGVNLGPQQTAEAYRAAIGYGADQVEVDLRLSADGVFVVAHDEAPASVDVPVESRRPVTDMTAAEYTALNAAVAPWTGTEFDPAHYQTFDAVLALAAAHHTGLDIEFKDIGAQRQRIREVAQAVADAGVMDRTIWQHGLENDVVALVRSVDPDAHFNVNIDPEQPPAFLYQQALTMDDSFGSKLEEFTADKIAAIHDGCGVALPHSYDGLDDRDQSAAETARERDQMRAGLARGIDGFQTNRPDAAAAALGQPVPSQLVRDGGAVCLVNADNGMPLPGRELRVGDDAPVTGKGGCVAVQGHRPARFDGDASALAAPTLRGGS